MNEELFAELLDSVREGGAILRGDKAPSRKFVIEPPDVKGIRLDQPVPVQLIHDMATYQAQVNLEKAKVKK